MRSWSKVGRWTVKIKVYTHFEHDTMAGSGLSLDRAVIKKHSIDVACQDLAGTEDVFLFKMLAEKNAHRRRRAETNEIVDDIYIGETPARTKETKPTLFKRLRSMRSRSGAGPR